MLNISNQYVVFISIAHSIDYLILLNILHKNYDNYQSSLFFFIKLHYVCVFFFNILAFRNRLGKIPIAKEY